MKSLVLCGGGIKSTFLAIEASKEGETSLLHIDYGQPNLTRELEALECLVLRCGMLLLQVKLPGFPPLDQTLLRLLCLFSRAAPIAKHFGYPKIYYGISRDDLPHTADPKLAEEFLIGLQHLLNLAMPDHDNTGLWLGKLELDTPLRKLKLEHIIRLGNEWGIDWTKTWSCMYGGKKHCGVCPKCIRRRTAFKLEGSREDPTDYAD